MATNSKDLFDRIMDAVIEYMLKGLGILCMGGSMMFVIRLWSDKPGTIGGRIFVTICLLVIFLVGTLCFKVSNKEKENNTNNNNCN